MLEKISKISYKFSTNAIFILFSIVADFLLDPSTYGKYVVVISIQVLIFNLSDYFNTKYLLGFFAQEKGDLFLKKVLSFKIFFTPIILLLFSSIYYFYDIPLNMIIVLSIANYTQLLSSTIATYIFANENNTKLLFSNVVGTILCILFLLLFYLLTNTFTLNSLFIAILLYRLGEVIYLYFSIQMVKIIPVFQVNKQNIKEAFPFYVQLILSIGGAKIFMLYLPYLLSYQEISIIGSYEYLTAIPLFFISVLTMSAYTTLFRKKLNIIFDYNIYQNIMRRYYKQAFLLVILFSLFQLIYIFMFKVSLYPYIPFLLLHNITLIYTAIQGYTLFFWKMNKLIIYISIFVLVVKNILIYYFVSIYGLVGYFSIIILVEFLIMTYLLLQVKKKITIRQG